MEGDSNRIVGNNNILKMESLSNNSSNPKDFKNIFVTGNQNTVTGDPDTSTAGDAGSVSDITVTGSKNTIQAKNQKNRNLTDIQIVETRIPLMPLLKARICPIPRFWGAM